MNRTVAPNYITVGGKRQATNGDPSVPTPATTWDAADWNAVQEEIVTLIEYAGLTPSAGNLTQLRAAIMAMGGGTVAAVSYYVNAATGSDSNDGLSAGAAKLTLQGAFDVIPAIVGHAVTVNVADDGGTPYAAATLCKRVVKGGSITLVGNTGTPANCEVSGKLTITDTRSVTVNGFEFSNATAAGYATEALVFSDVTFSNTRFVNSGALGFSIYCDGNSQVTVNSTCTISTGTNAAFAYVDRGGFISCAVTTATVGYLYLYCIRGGRFSQTANISITANGEYPVINLLTLSYVQFAGTLTVTGVSTGCVHARDGAIFDVTGAVSWTTTSTTLQYAFLASRDGKVITHGTVSMTCGAAATAYAIYITQSGEIYMDNDFTAMGVTTGIFLSIGGKVFGSKAATDFAITAQTGANNGIVANHHCRISGKSFTLTGNNGAGNNGTAVTLDFSCVLTTEAAMTYANWTTNETISASSAVRTV